MDYLNTLFESAGYVEAAGIGLIFGLGVFIKAFCTSNSKRLRGL
jgi:hypothetical protein